MDKYTARETRDPMHIKRGIQEKNELERERGAVQH